MSDTEEKRNDSAGEKRPLGDASEAEEKKPVREGKKRPEGRVPSEERRPGRVPPGEVRRRPEGKAPSGEIRRRPEGERRAPEGESRRRPEGERRIPPEEVRRRPEGERRRPEEWEEPRERRRSESRKKQSPAKKKWMKFLKISLITLGILFLLFVMGTLAVNGYMLVVDRRYVKTVNEWHDSMIDGEEIDCIFVLGCSVNPDRTPSAALKTRLDRVWDLYKLSPHKVLVSGDHSADGYYNEVRVMKDYLIDKGIPSEEIFIDHYGFSTYDSIYRAYYTFGVRRMTIVTENSHICRALFLASAIGMEADGVAAENTNITGTWELREVLARDKDFLASLFWSKPGYDGDSISLSGNGDDTNER